MCGCSTCLKNEQRYANRLAEFIDCPLCHGHHTELQHRVFDHPAERMLAGLLLAELLIDGEHHVQIEGARREFRWSNETLRVVWEYTEALDNVTAGWDNSGMSLNWNAPPPEMVTQRAVAPRVASMIQEDEFGALWEFRIRGVQPFRMVEVIDATPVNGHRARYLIGVPIFITTAKEGIAWSFNTTLDGYDPTRQT